MAVPDSPSERSRSSLQRLRFESIPVDDSKPCTGMTSTSEIRCPASRKLISASNRDNHTTMKDQSVMIGCVTALTKTTKENGATIVIPGSHKWDDDRPPY